MKIKLNENQGPEIRAVFRDFTPPPWINDAVSRLVAGIPAEYVDGLGTITLTDSSGLNRAGRRQKTLSRKRKVAIQECLGVYHLKWRGEPAWIELFIDNITADLPSWLFKVRFLQDVFLADVLYHEIGHHIHKTSAPEHKAREDVAEEWQKRLSRTYMRKRYWYLKRLRFIIQPLLKLVQIVANLMEKKRNPKAGSQAL